MKNFLLYLCLSLIILLQSNTVSCQVGWTNYTNTQGITDIEESETYRWISEDNQKLDLPTSYTGAMFITLSRNGRIQTEKIIKF